tara:strand:+ start:2356 stop:3801 length:1446 start_codon:yes stop_codon:yes gene_type:complete
MKQKIFGKTHLLLLLIVLFGLFLRLLFFSGMGISDSLAYSKTANDINEGLGIDPDSTLTLSTRLGLIFPTILSYRLFGINDFSSVVFVLIVSIASIILIFYFGKLLFNEKIGLMAALLFSFFPLDIVHATKLSSDLPSAFFMALGVYIFLYAEMKHKLKYGLSYLFSGIFIGIGYLIRESALLIALFFISYIIYKRSIKKEYFLIPLGILIIFVIEAFMFLSITGDPIYRTVSSQQYNTEQVITHNYFGRLDFPTGLFHYPWLFLTNSLLTYFYLFILIALIYVLAKKKKEIYSILLWFIPILLYLSFGSASLTQYIPFRAVDRYTSIVTIPGILLLAFFLSEKKAVIRKGIMPIALILLLVISTGTVYLREDRHLLDDLRESHPFLKNLDKTVFIDDRSLKALDYISEYAINKNLKKYPDNLDKVKDSYIVINLHMIRNLKEANKNLKFTDEIENIPKDWKIIKEIGKIEKDKIIVYYTS